MVHTHNLTTSDARRVVWELCNRKGDVNAGVVWELRNRKQDCNAVLSGKENRDAKQNYRQPLGATFRQIPKPSISQIEPI